MRTIRYITDAGASSSTGGGRWIGGKAAPLRWNTSLVRAELWMSVDVGDAGDVRVRNCRCLVWMSLGCGPGLGPNGVCHLALPTANQTKAIWTVAPARLDLTPWANFFLLIVIHPNQSGNNAPGKDLWFLIRRSQVLDSQCQFHQ